MTTPAQFSEAYRLTLAHRAEQARIAAAIALLVAVYYRARVQVENPESVARWLDIMVPRIVREHNRSAQLGATTTNTLRQLQLGMSDPFRYEPVTSITPEQVRRSLEVVGPFDYTNKAREVRGRPNLTPAEEDALIQEIKSLTTKKIVGSVLRHVQNGGRGTVEAGIKKDPVALGYVRVLQPNACYFCVMLASRGPIYSEDSFDASDPRFLGPGPSKVHDNCSCALTPIWRPEDPLMDDVRRYEQLWAEYSTGSGADAIRSFRRGYEGRADS